MQRISTPIHFALLLLLGSVSTHSNAKCSQNVTWTIQSGRVINNGTQYKFEVWARATDEPVLVTGNYSWDGLNTVTIQWNQNAFATFGDQQDHQIITYADKWTSPYYGISWGAFSGYPVVQVGFYVLPGNPSPSYLSTSVPYGELMFTVTLKIVDASFAPQLAWTTGYGYPVHGILGAANTYTIGDNGPLPIRLASFSALKYGANSMQLTWSTISEVNNYGFYVQKSLDRKNWEDVGELIRGHGTTLEPQQYSVTLPIANGSWWMRLKQIDLDGRVTASEAKLIEISPPVKFALNQNYPNPFNPSTQIAFSTTKEGPVSLRVYDILGREVATLVNENRKPGQYTERFDGGRVASGIYMYVLRCSEGQLTSRMILSK